MNLTLHLVRKDLRQFRLFALFWAALIAGQIVCALPPASRIVRP